MNTTATYEVTSTSTKLTRTFKYEAMKVMVNSNSSERMRENYSKLDNLTVGDSIVMTDNYGSMGGGEITVKRLA